MRLLELVSAGPVSAAQLASAMDAQPRTVRRVLGRLVEEEYLSSREVGRRRVFEPTMRIVALAGKVVTSSHLVAIARPHVDLLHERLGVAAHLTVPSYEAVLCVAHTETGVGAAAPHPRELVPAHCTAEGMALLAWRDRWRESLLAQPLEPHTSRTIVDPMLLRSRLDDVRGRGFAVEDGEFLDLRRSVAAPVTVDGEAVAALSASGTTSSLDLPQAIEAVTTVAGRLVDDLRRSVA